MSRKKILFLTHRVPFPPDKGDRIRTFHQLDELASSHDVYLACFTEHAEERKHLESLRRWCKQVVAFPWSRTRGLIRAARGLAGRRPLTLAAYADPRLMRQIETWNWKMDFDVATAFSGCMAPYALAARAGRRVLDLCDADSRKWLDYAEHFGGPKRVLHRLEGRRLHRFEQDCLARFDAVLVITARERVAIDPLHQQMRLRVVGNGINLPTGVIRPPSECGPTACFVGAMDYPPNVDAVHGFATTVWPRVLERHPRATFMIVGRNPTRRVRLLAKSNRIEVTGEVPDVNLYLNEARVVPAPLRIARGLQNKILEAMAMGRPVITTSAVAGSLDATPGHDFSVADTKEDFVEKISRLFEDDGLCDAMGAAARQCVIERYAWPRILRNYSRILFGIEADHDPPDASPVINRAPHEQGRLAPLLCGRLGKFRSGENRAIVR